MALFILLHSPVTGLLTWAHVANELWNRGIDVVVPGLVSNPSVRQSGTTYWQQHVEQVAESVAQVRSEGPGSADPDDAVVLVGHSEAGVLLPAIGETLERHIAAYIFCDADLPKDGLSRFDGLADANDVESFRRAADDEMLPPFPEAILEQTIPDPVVRSQFREDLRSTPIEIYEESIPVPDGWPNAPVAYLGFSKSRSSYPGSIKTAIESGWPISELEGAHFHMLVDPSRVSRALVDLAEKCGVEVRPKPLSDTPGDALKD